MSRLPYERARWRCVLMLVAVQSEPQAIMTHAGAAGVAEGFSYITIDVEYSQEHRTHKPLVHPPTGTSVQAGLLQAASRPPIQTYLTARMKEVQTTHSGKGQGSGSSSGEHGLGS